MFKNRDNRNQLTPFPKQAESTNQEKPVFSLIHLQAGHALSRCSLQEKAAFADTLHRLSGLTWGEIQNAPRHGLGFETIPRSAIKAGIPQAITPDIRILAFRCHGKAPMVGFRDGTIFHVVWMDRDFTLYDHG